MALFKDTYWCARFSLAGIAYCIRGYVKEKESFDPSFKLRTLPCITHPQLDLSIDRILEALNRTS